MIWTPSAFILGEGSLLRSRWTFNLRRNLEHYCYQATGNMSLSKEHLPVASTAGRQPKCTRCRHHGIIVLQKGHVKSCPFVTCECWKCYLITQRTRITAVQRNLKKVPIKEQPPSAVKRQAEGTFTNSAPEGGARPSGSYGLMCPPSDGAPERAASTAWSPHDPRSRAAAAGGEEVSGVDSGKMLSFASSAEGPCPPFGKSFFITIETTSSSLDWADPVKRIHFIYQALYHVLKDALQRWKKDKLTSSNKTT